MKWKLEEVSLDKLVNPKTDLRFVRSQVFKTRLSSSISEFGVLEPLKVRSRSDSRFEILDGVTRKQDLIEQGYSGSVLCLVTTCSDEDALTLQCVFASMRRNLDSIGFARYVKLKHDEGKTLTKIGEPFRLKKSQVSKYLALNKLSDEDKRRVANREITIDQAYALVTAKRMLPPSYTEPKPLPCPYCGESVDSPFLIRTSICVACEERVKKAIARERRYKHPPLQ